MTLVLSEIRKYQARSIVFEIGRGAGTGPIKTFCDKQTKKSPNHENPNGGGEAIYIWVESKMAS